MKKPIKQAQREAMFQHACALLAERGVDDPASMLLMGTQDMSLACWRARLVVDDPDEFLAFEWLIEACW